MNAKFKPGDTICVKNHLVNFPDRPILTVRFVIDGRITPVYILSGHPGNWCKEQTVAFIDDNFVLASKLHRILG